MQTNFESMIARYQTMPNNTGKNNLEEPAVVMDKRKGSTDYKQAQ